MDDIWARAADLRLRRGRDFLEGTGLRASVVGQQFDRVSKSLFTHCKRKARDGEEIGVTDLNNQYMTDLLPVFGRAEARLALDNPS